jgi:hypothetical protein
MALYRWGDRVAIFEPYHSTYEQPVKRNGEIAEGIVRECSSMTSDFSE